MIDASSHTNIRSVKHRSLFVLAGDQYHQMVELVAPLIRLICANQNPAPESRCLWLDIEVSNSSASDNTAALTGVSNTERISARTVTSMLGSEADFVVVNAVKLLDCDALAAITGSIKGGGSLILLMPSFDSWYDTPEHTRNRQKHSLFLGRFARLLRTSTHAVALNDEPGKRNYSTDVQVRMLRKVSVPEQGDRYAEQNALIYRLLTWTQAQQSQDPPPVFLLTADRGRGKSAAMGKLLARFQGTALVCAPRKKAVDILYSHFIADNGTSRATPDFCPPDQLSTVAVSDLLIIDEAAGIPLPLLRTAAQRFGKVIFCSTVQGYEGAGRGFALRFGQLLQRDSIRYSREALLTPIRWLPDDPLEQFINSTLLLDAPLPAISTNTENLYIKTDIKTDTLEYHTGPQQSELILTTVEAKSLRDDETLLRSVYGLLVQAHYRTTPGDLQIMLDSDNLETHLLHYQNDLIAAALVAKEGPILDLSLRQAILAKERRPQGHLLPQLLSQYTMRADALDYRYARIVRIAVLPQLQGRGIGSAFLKLLTERHEAREQKRRPTHLLGAMFGAVPDTLNFWVKNDFQPVHLGYRKQTSSGYASVTVLKALSDKTDPIQRFASGLYQDMLSFKFPMSAESAVPDSSSSATAHASLYDQQILSRFMHRQRSFHDSHAALSRLAQAMHEQPATNFHPDAQESALINACRDPAATPKSLSEQTGLASQGAAEDALRSLLNKWYRSRTNHE